MTLSELLNALRAEHADRITIFAEGCAMLYTKGNTFRFESLADLEKNFAQASTPSAPSTSESAACTCDQAQTLLRDCLHYLSQKFPDIAAGPACNCTGC